MMDCKKRFDWKLKAISKKRLTSFRKKGKKVFLLQRQIEDQEGLAANQNN